MEEAIKAGAAEDMPRPPAPAGTSFPFFGDGLMAGEPDATGNPAAASAASAASGVPGGREPLRFVVLASGNGSNFQAVAEACAAGAIRGRVVALVSDKKEAFALERAARAGIPGLALPSYKGVPRRDYDTILAQTIAAFRPDYVLLLGWMRLLSSAFLSRFPMRVINIHPALPGAFPGTRAIDRAFEAFRKGRMDRTGIMIHFVPDEGVDDGPVIAVAEVPIDKNDDLVALELKVHAAEHRLLTETLTRIASSAGNEE